MKALITRAPRTALQPVLRFLANSGGGFCEQCQEPVNTVNGRYHCHACGHNGGSP
ncbi:hypothetical protein ACFV42_48120 [Streptomyces solisilvae]|uniref:hypothetical protein n=1 Tax=Streptomyces malaysiensis TaxID=92644 RepID=UPI0036B2DA64